MKLILPDGALMEIIFRINKIERLPARKPSPYSETIVTGALVFRGTDRHLFPLTYKERAFTVNGEGRTEEEINYYLKDRLGKLIPDEWLLEPAFVKAEEK